MRARILSCVLVSLVVIPTAYADHAANAKTFRGAVQQTKAHVEKGTRFVLKGGKWAAIGTAAAVGGTVAVAGIGGFLTREPGTWFNPAMMDASLRLANKIGRYAFDASPYVAGMAGIGGAAYVGAPMAKYAGGKAIEAWRNGGLKADVAVGAMAAGATLGLGLMGYGTTNPEVVATNGFLAQYGSTMSRLSVNGAAKLVQRAGK